ncbi:MAG: dndD [Bacteroidetes bacterium]|nr:dndD [Bacteroidota bacterium]
MIIKEIELNNFRIYKHSNIISLAPEGKKNISLISGRNGFGKTTFLMSLVWCLYGKQMQEVDDLYQKEIGDQGGYNKYIINSLNRLAKVEGETQFFVAITFSKLNIPDLPCKEIRIKRTYDIETTTGETVEILIDGIANELTNDLGPEYFIRDYILPKEIAKFFFFDAEKITALAEVNSPEQRKKLSEAYSEVLGIKKYEELKGNLEELQIKLRQESASENERKELIALTSSIDIIDLDIEEHEAKIANNKDAILEKRKESNDIQEKLIRAGSAITVEELNKLRNNEAELSTRLDDLMTELKEQFEIIPFAIAGSKFSDVSLQIENEANFKKLQYQHDNIKGITDKVLNDLLKEKKPENIVIDHNVHAYYSDLFKSLIKKHFFADAPELESDFKTIHDYSDSERGELNALLNSVKFSFKESFKRITGDVNQTKNELNLIRKKLRDAEANSEDSVISGYRIKKDKLDTDIMHLETLNSEFDKNIGAQEANKVQINKKIIDITKKLNVSKANKAKDELVTSQINNLKEFIKQFKEDKKRSLEKQILKGLETLMHKKDFVKKVQVDIIGDDIDIRLFNNRKEEIKKETLSKGEQQMYATSLLSGLVEESNIDFPVFIDSPMQKFDEQHAENIVKYFYPKVSDQVVIFPLINKELSQKEFNMLEPNISKTYLINNLHEDSSEFKEIEPSRFIKTYNKMYNDAN